jgi:hypothetical protein
MTGIIFELRTTCDSFVLVKEIMDVVMVGRK